MTLACRIASRCEAAIASPWSLPAYVAIRLVMCACMSTNTITLWLSDASMILLLLMSIADKRRSAKQEAQLDALARVNPDVDDAAIEAGA